MASHVSSVLPEPAGMSMFTPWSAGSRYTRTASIAGLMLQSNCLHPSLPRRLRLRLHQAGRLLKPSSVSPAIMPSLQIEWAQSQLVHFPARN